MKYKSGRRESIVLKFHWTILWASIFEISLLIFFSAKQSSLYEKKNKGIEYKLINRNWSKFEKTKCWYYVDILYIIDIHFVFLYKVPVNFL